MTRRYGTAGSVASGVEVCIGSMQVRSGMHVCERSMGEGEWHSLCLHGVGR